MLSDNTILISNGDGIMNLAEFYNAIESDYNEIKRNLMSDEIIEELVLEFLKDNSFNSLKNAFEAGDIDSAFLGAHTLKGVSASLGFKSLAVPVSAITEKLRNKKMPSSEEMEQIERQYNKVINSINEYK